MTIYQVSLMMLIDNDNRKLWSVNEQAMDEPIPLISTETSILQKYVLSCTMICW